MISSKTVSVKTVYMARGAWVEGRINVSSQALSPNGTLVNRTLPLYVLGHGIMSGSRYSWHGGTAADGLRFFEPSFSTSMHFRGPTFVDPKGHALILPAHSSAVGIKVLGWLFNEDGIWLTTNSSLLHSFVRTNDDSVRIYAGAVDHVGPSEHTGTGIPATDVNVEGLTVHQLFNGGVLQVGWESYGTHNFVAKELDVVGAEWYWVPSSMNATAGDHGNNAVLSLQAPQYDVGMLEHHSNWSVTDVRLDVPVGRIVALSLRGAAPPPGNCSHVRNVALYNITLLAANGLHWFPTANLTSPPQPGENLLCALRCDSISRITFQNVVVGGGKAVLADADWNLDRVGNVTNVEYSIIQ